MYIHAQRHQHACKIHTWKSKKKSVLGLDWSPRGFAPPCPSTTYTCTTCAWYPSTTAPSIREVRTSYPFHVHFHPSSLWGAMGDGSLKERTLSRCCIKFEQHEGSCEFNILRYQQVATWQPPLPASCDLTVCRSYTVATWKSALSHVKKLTL